MKPKFDADVQIRCYSQEKAEWVAASLVDDRDLSSWIRTVLNKEIERSGVKRGKHRSKLPQKSE